LQVDAGEIIKAVREAGGEPTSAVGNIQPLRAGLRDENEIDFIGEVMIGLSVENQFLDPSTSEVPRQSGHG
jgi:hypothetical protein